VDIFSFKGHAIFGLGCAFVVSYLTGFELSASHLSGILVGVMLPDMDHPHSKINYKLLKFNNRIWKTVFYVVIGFLALAYGLENDHVTSVLGVALIWTGISSHRTFTHSFLGGVLYSVAIFKLGGVWNDMSFLVAIMFGYWSHLVSDSATPAGVHWMYPMME